MKPSLYFRRQCFVTIEPDEPQLAQTIDWLGRDRVLFGSDFPHLDHPHSVATELKLLDQALTRETLQALFWDNPRNANLMAQATEH